MPTRELGVWLHGTRVADLRGTKTGSMSLRYSTAALERFPGNAPLISCSLPLRRQRQDASAFCEGLLPEGQHRQALASLARVPSFDKLGILTHFGRDVAGALVIAQDEPGERSPGVIPYTADSLDDEVRTLDEHPLGAYDDSELSIAGLQDKILLVRLPDGTWGRPIHGSPSTHILKADSLRFPGIVTAEHAALQLARASGLPAPASELATLGDRDVLIIERFDRRTAGGTYERIHQEDVCQALGIDPSRAQGHAKYESAGGPSFDDIAKLLQQWGRDAERELEALLRTVVFTVLIGNADAHGKNIALLHPDATSIELAPLYDVVPTALWPGLRTEAGMFVAGVKDLRRVRFDHLVDEAVRWPVPRARALAVARDTCDRVHGALVEIEHDELRSLVAQRLDALTRDP